MARLPEVGKEEDPEGFIIVNDKNSAHVVSSTSCSRAQGRGPLAVRQRALIVASFSGRPAAPFRGLRPPRMFHGAHNDDPTIASA